MLGHMLVLGDIEILEHWLQMDSLDLNSLSVFFKDHINLANFIIGHIKILLSSKGCVLDSYWGDRGCWNLLDAVGGKSGVDIRAELNVVEHKLGIARLVPLSK